MQLTQPNRKSNSKVYDILEKLKAGLSREEISDQFGYTTWKSLDIYMRRKGFRWDSQRRIYTNAQAEALLESTQEVISENYLDDDNSSNSTPEDIVKFFGLGILDAREIAKKAGFSDHKEMAAYMRRHGYIWSPTESNYVNTNPEPQEQKTRSSNKSEDKLEVVEERQSITPLSIDLLSNEKYYSLLEYLWKSRNKLIKLLDSIDDSEKTTIKIYNIPGEAKTKSIFFSNELSELMTAFCKEHSMSQKQGFEAALIEYLSNHGYEEQVKKLLQ